METARRARLAALAVALGLAAAASLPASCGRRNPAAGPAGGDAGAQPAAATAALHGQVVDGRDAPIPGARVVALPAAAPGSAGLAATAEPEPAEAVTGPDGRFLVERLHPGRYRLLVEAAGFASAELAPVEAPGAPVRVHMAGEGHAVSGRAVEAGGAPAAGARVRLSAGNGAPPRDAVARDDGSFAFTGLGAGTYALRATRGALASPVAGGVTLDGGRAPAPVRLELQPAVAVTGRVVDDRGAPVPGADVRVERDVRPGPGPSPAPGSASAGGTAGADADDPLPELARAGADGRFQTGPLPAGDYRLLARRAGYLLRRPVTLRLAPPAAATPSAAPPPATLELVRGAAVVGRVTDARGAPLAGATVRCLAVGAEDLAVLTDPLPPAAEAAALPSGAGHGLGTARTATSQAGGAFEIADLLPGRYHLEVSRPGAAPLRTGELAVGPGARHDAGALALRDGVAVSGRVTDDAGAPVAGARVAVADAGLYALTDAAGAFTLALAPGRYTLEATAAGLAARSLAVTVAAAPAPPPPVTFALGRADGALEGLVRDDGGRPLARARVTALAEAGARALGAATTDAGGHFAIARLPPGPALLEVRHPSYPATTQPVTPGALAVVTVPIPGRVDGEVRDRVTGAVVPRARVAASGPEGRTASAAVATAARGGAFTLPRLVPGRWRLTASAPGFAPAEREVEVPPSAALGEPSVRALRLELERS